MLGPQTTLTLQSVSMVSDAMGGMTETWTTIASISGVLGRASGESALSKSKGSEVLVAGSINVLGLYTFFCDVPSVSISEKNRFLLGTRTFDILFIRNPGEMNHHLEITLFEIKGY